MNRKKAVESRLEIGDIREVSGEINIAGGDINIRNVYQTNEDDLPLSSNEIENGLVRFAQFLPERAPILRDSFSAIAKKLRLTLGADQNSLSRALKSQREDGVDGMKLMCMEVMDISFRALCLGQNPPPYDSRSPFLGLFAFHPEEKDFFFGREALVQKLVTSIKKHPFLAVLGNSGSGKSSLVMAGLIPALKANMSYIRPASVPLYQLLAAKESANDKTVFVIDQFEELFTHPHDSTERADFIQALLELTETNRVVITMRADFWGEIAIYPDLKQMMQEHQELIAPMNVGELQSAMHKQAAVVGLRFDPTLSESILAEVKGEPGAMPLLQHALWELWNRRHGFWIKAEEYQAFGGVKQAIASTAEEVYASCSEFEQNRVRDIFLRLTRLDESGEERDTRRRVLIKELVPVNSDISATIKLLNKLADTRLIVKTDKDVEVAHEALIRHWSRLTEWLNEDRDNLRLREGVSESARDWENSNRDNSLLNHRGGRLELALAMSRSPRYELNPSEQMYLNACISLRIKEQSDRERRLRWTVTASVAIAIIFLVLGNFAIIKGNAASTAQAKAEEQARVALSRQLAAQALSHMNDEYDLALLLNLTAFQATDTVEARSNMLSLLQYNPRLESFIHGVDGDSVAISPDGHILAAPSCAQVTDRICNQGEIILWDISNPYAPEKLGVPLIGHTASVSSIVFSPDGKTLASGSRDETIILWNVSNLQMPQQIGKPLRGHTSGIENVAFSQDGKWLASAGGFDQTIILWDVSNLNTLKQSGRALTGHTAHVSDIAFSPNSLTLVSGSYDGRIILWDVMTGQQLGESSKDLNVSTESIAFSPNGNLVASAAGNDGVILWDVTDPGTPYLMGSPLNIHTSYVSSVKFSPDGKTLASGSEDKSIILWDISDPHTPLQLGKPLVGHAGRVSSIAFSPNGQILASSDGSVILWNVSDLSTPTHDLLSTPLSGHADTVESVAFSPDGKTLASGSSDKTIILWDATTRQRIGQQLTGHTESVLSLAFSPDSKTLASFGMDKIIILWDVSNLKKPPIQLGAPLKMPNNTYGDYDVAFSPDGKTLAGSLGNVVILWDITNLEAPIQASMPLTTGVEDAAGTVFSPDGKMLASGGMNGTIFLWDVSNPRVPQPLSTSTAPLYNPVFSVAFSPDGKTLASAGIDRTISLWDISSPKTPKLVLGERLTGHTDTLRSVVFSPDGRTLASGGLDGTIILWDVSNPQTPQRLGASLSGYDGWVQSLAFSPDGKTLASGNGKTIVLWDVNPDSWREHACQIVGRNFRQAEWSRYLNDEPYRQTCPQWPADLGYFRAIAENALSNDQDPIRVKTALDKVKVAVTQYGYVKDPGAESLSIVSAAVVAQILSEAGNMESVLDLFEQAKQTQVPISVGDKKLIFGTIAIKALSNSNDPNRVNTAYDKVRTVLVIYGKPNNPSAEALNIVSTATAAQISAEADATNIEKALDLFEQARRLQMQITIDDKNTLNDLCWFGSLQGHANQALQYCEMAVKLAPDDAAIHDSRGLARALTGDYQGAILDFQYLVEHINRDDLIEQRKQWIEQLKKGINPFTAEVLESLMDQ